MKIARRTDSTVFPLIFYWDFHQFNFKKKCQCRYDWSVTHWVTCYPLLSSFNLQTIYKPCFFFVQHLHYCSILYILYSLITTPNVSFRKSYESKKKVKLKLVLFNCTDISWQHFTTSEHRYKHLRNFRLTSKYVFLDTFTIQFKNTNHSTYR